MSEETTAKGSLENISLSGMFGQVKLDEPVNEVEYGVISIETQGRHELIRALGGELSEGARVNCTVDFEHDNVRVISVELET